MPREPKIISDLKCTLNTRHILPYRISLLSLVLCKKKKKKKRCWKVDEMFSKVIQRGLGFKIYFSAFFMHY